MIAQALSGVMFLNGEEHMPPMKIGTSIADVLAGIHLVIGLVSALYRVKTTGEGCFVETALVDSLVSALIMEQINYFHNQTIPPRIGNDYREWCPAGVFESKDGWFVLASGHEKDFRALAQCIGQTAWLTDESMQSHAARVKQRDHINAVINEWGRNKTTEEACRLLRQADIPCSPVYNLPDVVADSHIAGTRNMFPQYLQPGIGMLTATNIPLRFHDIPLVPPCAAPKLGQDTASVLQKLLSLSDSEVEQLRRSSVCG
jgi:crotonobetainyl-CoA:carnitine CoA-transferase CaiB-like acyl-CoA transferase